MTDKVEFEDLKLQNGILKEENEILKDENEIFLEEIRILREENGNLKRRLEEKDDKKINQILKGLIKKQENKDRKCKKKKEEKKPDLQFDEEEEEEILEQKKSHVCGFEGCKKRYAVWQNLVAHIKKVHEQTVKKSQKPRKNLEKRKCWVCSKQLESSLSKHLFNQHEIKDRIVDLTVGQKKWYKQACDKKKDILDPLPKIGSKQPLITG